MLNFIFIVCIYPTLFLMYFIQKGEGTSNLRTLFGIRYSKDWLPDSEREQFETEYRRSMNRYLLILGILPIVTFFIPYFSISFSFWMIWMLVVIVIFMLPYFQGNRKLLELKKERCQEASANNILYAELKNAGVIRRVKWQSFIVPSLISILLAVASTAYFYQQNLEVYGTTIIVFALCTPLFYLCAIYMDRMKTKIISTDSNINVNYTRASKNIYKNFWLLSAWLNTLFIVLLLVAMVIEAALNGISSYAILWGVILYSIVELLLCMRMLRQIHELAQQYEKYRNFGIDHEEDHWIGGILYYNPKDKHTMVEKRVGIGTTINLATPVGKASAIITILSLLIIPIMCVWMILLEFTPITLFVNDNMLIARHLKNDYVINTSTITELSLEEELPRSTKINGTAMDNLEKGKFRNSVDGRIQIFLNPQNQYYLRIVSGDTIYYMGGYDDEETLAIYDLLSTN